MGFWKKLWPSLAEQEMPPEPVEPPDTAGPVGVFDVEAQAPIASTVHNRIAAFESRFPVVNGAGPGHAMDSDDGGNSTIKTGMHGNQPLLSDELYMWYARRGFIGHQLAALMLQNWLVAKCCAMPARDALRSGWKIVSATGKKLSEESTQKLKELDERISIDKQLEEFICMGRGFGVRIAIPDVEYIALPEGGNNGETPESLPFNIDGVVKGSYKGWIQVDPYWCAPILDAQSAGNPASRHFFEPTWWLINGKRYHRSHLCIYRHGILPDILRPAYQYGGIPVPQLVLERIYGAERTSDEAPLLVLTKRTVVYKTDLTEAAKNFKAFTQRVMQWSKFWSNTGQRVIGKEEDHVQHDTALSDLDAIIMTQYQIVAAAAEVPGTELLGTTPKGFNSTGEHETRSYNKTLMTLQKSDCTPFLRRHYQLAAYSLGLSDATLLQPAWIPLDAPTRLERAQEDAARATAAQALIAAGVIDAADEAARLNADEDGPYAGKLEVKDDGPGSWL